MKTDRIRLIWIDDDITHRKDAENLNKLNDNLLVDFFHPVAFRKETKKQNVDLFLMDYNLSMKECDSEYYEGKGLSFIGLARERYPEIPIYLFSVIDASDLYGELSIIANKEADLVLSYAEIQDMGHQTLYYDAIDYRKIRKKSHKSIDELISLLCPPEEEKEKIEFILPEILKGKTAIGKSTQFATWVRNVFLIHPGFVYDSLYAATKIGMSEEAYLKRRHMFSNALYHGIFSKTVGKELWWKVLLYKLLFEKAAKIFKKEMQVDIKKISTKFFKLKEKEIAKCSICGEPYPETVGINLKTGERKPIHHRCGESDPKFTKMLYFDEIITNGE